MPTEKNKDPRGNDALSIAGDRSGIWKAPLSTDACRSLLALAGLQEAAPNRSMLAKIGMSKICRCRRVREGKYQNFMRARAV